MRYIIRFAVICAYIAAAPIAHAQSRNCPAPLAEKADAAVDEIDSWKRLEKFHQQYAACDDGSIAEGISESVARLLVDKPEALTSAHTYLLKHPAFAHFVIKHADSTLDTADLEALSRFSPNACKGGMDQFCLSIRSAASEALKPATK